MTSIVTPAEIGLRLYQLRAERGWSGRLVAQKIGVNHVSYYHWEWGKYRIPLEHAMRIAAVYGTTVEAIFGDGEPTPLDLDKATFVAPTFQVSA